MHANGRGIAQDFKEAIKWYKKSAEQGNVNAQYNLGNLYLRGQGATQNDNLQKKIREIRRKGKKKEKE